MRIRPITFAQAREFVVQHHRHNKPPVGHKFSVGLVTTSPLGAELLIGVATCGRPVARAFDDGLTLEINRTCTTGEPNANSMLYGACRQIAKAMGYTRVITYTQHDESGASLRAAGFILVKELAARASWAESSGPAWKASRDKVGTGGVVRILWEVRFNS
jgi:hypothetical protein